MNATLNNRKAIKGAACALGVVLMTLAAGPALSKGISESAVVRAATTGANAGATAAIQTQLLPTQLDQLQQLKNQVDTAGKQLDNLKDQFNLEKLTKNVIDNQLERMEQNLQQWGGYSTTRDIQSLDDSFFNDLSKSYDDSLSFVRNSYGGIESGSGSKDATDTTAYEQQLSKGGAKSQYMSDQAKRVYSNAKAGAGAAGKNASSIKGDDYVLKGLSDDNAYATGNLQAQQIGNAATIEAARQSVKLRDAITTQTTMAANSQAEIAEREAKEAAFQKGFFETSKINTDKGKGF